MAVDRIERINALLKRVLGEAMPRVLANDDVQSILITVTGVFCAADLRDATVSVSVFGDEALQERALGHLVHHARDFQRAIAREVKLKFTPLLHFKLDHSLEKGDKVLQILDSL
ncbi:MAG: 30S ribosome-binding factor RbfA [Kiritimatiellae bacterium]|nr:30S ribosome-binding factor RbfA [Kiritimatiellia bacterium]